MPLSKARDKGRKRKIRLDASVGHNCFHCVFSVMYPDSRLRCNRDMPTDMLLGYTVKPNQSPCQFYQEKLRDYVQPKEFPQDSVMPTSNLNVRPDVLLPFYAGAGNHFGEIRNRRYAEQFFSNLSYS